MKTWRKLPLAVLLTIVAVASGCGKPPPKRDLRAEKQLVAKDGIPALREELKRDTLARAKELDEAVDILVARTRALDLDGSVSAYREVRRRERDLSPLARLLAPVSSSGFGAYGTDKDDGAEGFRPLHDALTASPPSFEQALSRAKTAKRRSPRCGRSSSSQAGRLRKWATRCRTGPTPSARGSTDRTHPTRRHVSGTCERRGADCCAR